MITNLLRSLGIAPTPTPHLSNPAPARRPLSRQTVTNPRVGADLISLIGFNDQAFLISPPAEPWAANLAGQVLALPSRIGGGSTNIASALRLALEMSRRCPRGCRRRLYLLSDGDANVDIHDTEPAAQAIADAFINLNVIAFGEAANSRLLKRLAAKTHHGKFIPVDSLHAMASALKQGSGRVQAKRQHRCETSIVCVDLSPSMGSRDMAGKTRIEAVRDALKSLLVYKTQVWG